MEEPTTMRAFTRTSKAICAAIVLALAATLLGAVPVKASGAPLTPEEARAIAVEAYVYFYPMVTMDITRKQMTNIEPGKEIGKGPMNMFSNAPEYPPADMRVVVRPNFDTLYSSAWLDLTKEPMVISVPDTGA